MFQQIVSLGSMIPDDASPRDKHWVPALDSFWTIYVPRNSTKNEILTCTASARLATINRNFTQ
ncbi:hypothetical protein N7495_008123 [Penicillium taxi]|uniref:uncharacterized protein n=1 Tax=Penicillium taxi TaxID=168475 RepID=UPI002544F6C9|nr:uncharacterized protein N7495_008123 [Penicillium taxi]KAJ5888082.1 hypothetical protein N7495_008123 [Penicillium taxi]